MGAPEGCGGLSEALRAVPRVFRGTLRAAGSPRVDDLGLTRGGECDGAAGAPGSLPRGGGRFPPRSGEALAQEAGEFARDGRMTAVLERRAGALAGVRPAGLDHC